MALVDVIANGTMTRSPVIPTNRYLRFTISDKVLEMLSES